MDELKNLVIQTLETNGILGQLRAQLRSCVFKVIDNQEQIEKKQSSLHFDNPQAKKILSTASGVICAELVKDFLEYYKLDYTLSIYMPEVNLNQQQAMSKDELINKVGLQSTTEQKPVMMQLLESFIANDQPAKHQDNKQYTDTYNYHQQEATKVEPIQQKSFEKKDIQKSFKEETSTEKNIERANQMLEEQSREEKSGYKAEISKLSAQQAAHDRYKQDEESKHSEEDIIDNYNDDFEDDIEEDLPEDNHLLDSVDNQQRAVLTESAGGITVSQSLGVDPSVDSLALDDYDHIEPVERLS